MTLNTDTKDSVIIDNVIANTVKAQTADKTAFFVFNGEKEK